MTLNADGTFTYTPAANLGNNPLLQFTIIDRWGASITRSVQVNVIDARLLAIIGSKTVNEATALSFTIGGADPDLPGGEETREGERACAARNVAALIYADHDGLLRQRGRGLQDAIQELT